MYLKFGKQWVNMDRVSRVMNTTYPGSSTDRVALVLGDGEPNVSVEGDDLPRLESWLLAHEFKVKAKEPGK